MTYARDVRIPANGPPRDANAVSPRTSANDARPTMRESTTAARTRCPYSAYSSGPAISAPMVMPAQSQAARASSTSQMRGEKGEGALPCQCAGGFVELWSRRFVEPVPHARVDMELGDTSALHERLLGASHVVEGLEFVPLREVTEDRRHGLARLDL